MSNKGLTVLDVVAACEYVGCDVLDALGNEIEVTKENCSEIYGWSVESLAAKDSRVLIYTFKNMDKLLDKIYREGGAE